MKKHFLGLDIGGTSFKCGVIDDNNNIIYQNSIATSHNQTNTEALDNMSLLIDDSISKYPDIATIGIGLPCVVNNDKIIMAPNLPN
jgi:predicted NBD/HSP70 family sugar kinase